ncbi:hypothetical protein TWF569_007931 [Orbilia oligospora]|uniref:Uncharacterized protein n=1 Tax=Orbilia oligospora TaxID=2813651 RepID=A0A7C8JK65_ORBOL|nr:hypothetical protein TWF102_000368 [Orbilia oligospora]KAF3113824.1 hypothetical protein TWF706_009194 [Orbilia oligospora]KAF3115930.1 hypothetical protein TWF103_010159 [Orbilia oligospora]KAF3149627.1 hypothetical protein TWF594_010728 [Orbilia oligospora]KAF3155889.1 hypothetical protein TWF569_007931 [Orbilia oligospora]
MRNRTNVKSGESAVVGMQRRSARCDEIEIGGATDAFRGVVPYKTVRDEVAIALQGIVVIPWWVHCSCAGWAEILVT